MLNKNALLPENNTTVDPIKESLLACKTMVKYVLLFGFVLNILMLSTPLYSMQVLDRVLSSYNTNTLLMLTLVIIMAQLLQACIQGGRAFAASRMGSWFESRLSEIVFKNAIRIANQSRAHANSQQLRDLQTIKTYLTSPSLIGIMDVPWAIIFLIVLFILHVWIGSLALVGGIIIVSVAFFADRSTRKLIEQNNERYIQSMKYVDQATRNAEVIEVMGLSKNIIKSWQKLNTDVQAIQSATNERQAVFMELTKFIRTLLQIMITCLGAYLFTRGQFSSGAIIASSSLVGRALAPFEMAINSWKGYINCMKAYKRLNSAFTIHPVGQNKMSLPAPNGSIAGENIYFAYPKATAHLIKAATFSINPGECIVMIGTSGSGKTTMIKIIAGILKPAVGSIRIDGASISDWQKEELGQYIGYLPQDVELFPGTIRENIARMDPDGDPEKVVRAAQLAGIHEMVLRLPQAYDTVLDVDGSSLSGGQRQRIGLARAFYNDPKIIILDEPNSNLDSQGENALSTAIQIAKEEKITSIIASHRMSLLQVADKVMMMQDGTIAAFDTAANITAKLQQAQQNHNNTIN